MGGKRETLVALLVITTVLLLAATYLWHVKNKAEIAKEQSTPAFQALDNKEQATIFKDLAGNELSLRSEIGSILIVNSWASWSPDSAADLLLLDELAQQHQSDEIKVIAINRAETDSAAKRFLKHVGVTDNVKLILDPQDHYYKSIGGYAMPETVLYDKQGNIVAHFRGPLKRQELVRKIEEQTKE